METEPLSNTSKPKPKHPWLWVWLVPAIITLLAFFSFNWSQLPGPPLAKDAAEQAGWWAIAFALGLIGAALPAGVLAFSLLILAAFRRDYRLLLIRLGIALAVSVAGVFLSAYVRDQVETMACRWIAWRGRSVIRAVERYHSEHGRYPTTLTALKPHYLRTVPTPALLGSREFSYETPDGTESRFSPMKGSYDLHVWFFGFSDVPSVHYRPEKRYPKRMGGGRLDQRVGDWAYVWTEGAPL